jgi:membrane protease YdiL (CAAX protease family)
VSDEPTEAAATPQSAATALRGFGLLGWAAMAAIALAGNLGPVPAGALLTLGWARVSRTPLHDLGFLAPRRWTVTVPLAIGFGSAFKLFLKSVLMPLLGAPAINARYHGLAGNTAALPVAIVTMIVAAGFGEETVFRGLLFERFRSGLGDTARVNAVAVVAGATLFGLAHVRDQGVFGALQAAIVGLTFGAIYARTRSLPFLMIAHASFDLTALAMIYTDNETRFAHLLFK